MRSNTVNSVYRVLQFVDRCEPLEKNEAVSRCSYRRNSNACRPPGSVKHDHEAVSEPMSSLTPCPYIFDQRQKIIGVSIQRARSLPSLGQRDALVERVAKSLSTLNDKSASKKFALGIASDIDRANTRSIPEVDKMSIRQGAGIQHFYTNWRLE